MIQEVHLRQGGKSIRHNAISAKDKLVKSFCKPRFLAAMVVLAATACPSFADRVVRLDGRELQGRIIEENADSVTLEVDRFGIKATFSIPTKDIRTIVREDIKPEETPTPFKTPAVDKADKEAEPVGPEYYPIPIVGEIGLEVKAEWLAMALKDARKYAPNYIVLYIDSVGGSVEETKLIQDVLAGAQDLPIVALVHRALSAAAIVAISCPDIYMTHGGTIGGAVPYQIDSNGLPKAVKEKFLSIIRAQFRSAAELGGHPVLLVEGMMDTDLELSLVKHNGSTIVAKAADAVKLTKAAKNAKKTDETPVQIPLKARGEIMTLTSGEALECGLAKGISKDLESLHEVLEHETWSKSPGIGWRLITGKVALARRKQETRERQEALAAHLEEIQPKLDEIDGEIEKIKGDIKLVEEEKKIAKETYKLNTAIVNEKYRSTLQRAGALSMIGRGKEGRKLKANAKSTRDNQLNSLELKYRSKILQLDLKIKTIKLQQLKPLEDQRKKLLLSQP